MKKKFILAIEELVIKEFSVYANNVDEALELAKQKYKSGEFVLEPGEVTYKQMAITKPEDDATEWVEF